MYYSFMNSVLLIFFVNFLWRTFREANIGNWSDTSLLMISFLSLNEVSKIKFVNILSIKETVLRVTLVDFVMKGKQPCAKIRL